MIQQNKIYEKFRDLTNNWIQITSLAVATLIITLECFLCLCETLIAFCSCMSESVKFVQFIKSDENLFILKKNRSRSVDIFLLRELIITSILVFLFPQKFFAKMSLPVQSLMQQKSQYTKPHHILMIDFRTCPDVFLTLGKWSVLDVSIHIESHPPFKPGLRSV